MALLWQGINRKIKESQLAGLTFCPDKHSFYDVLLKKMGQITLLNQKPHKIICTAYKSVHTNTVPN